MQPLGTNKLLNSIVEITEQRDCSRFRESLCKTIREMTPVIGIAFVRPVERAPNDKDSVASYELVYQDPPLEHYNASFWGTLDDPKDTLNPQHVLDMMYNGHSLSMTSHRVTLLLPIMARDILAEILVIRADNINQDSVFLLQSFARLYRNFLSLISENEQDPLTGLYNRRVLETRLASVLRTAEQRHRLLRPVSGDAEDGSVATLRPYLAVFDIDKFKRINDTLGHLFGDEIILLVSQLMREIFRGHDTLFRYGGDEFVVILMAADRAGARAALERFREKIAEHHFPQLDTITTSIGFVEIHGGELPATVIGKADQALYQAKTEGRNRICDYDEVLAHGDTHLPIEHSDAEMF